MSKLKLGPQPITKHVWYYEEHNGITIVHSINHDNKYIRTDVITIPWRKIRASLKRKDAK